MEISFEFVLEMVDFCIQYHRRYLYLNIYEINLNVYRYHG